MKINKGVQIAFLAIFCLGASCTGDFEEMNTDPNRPKEIFPGVLLGQMQYRFVNTTMGGARGFTHQVMQVDAPRASTDLGLHRYHIAPNTGSDLWTSMYSYMTDIEDLYNISERLGEDNYKAIALIYKSLGYSIVTDCFGDIPYFQASKAEQGVFHPDFDRQADIYPRILADLAEANQLLSSAGPLAYDGDLVYSGDIAAWRKFANSLRLRLLLRISKRDGEVNVSSQINEMLGDPARYPMFEGPDDDAIFRYPGAFPYFNPYFNARTLDWREGRYFTEFFIDHLNAVEDPRRELWSTTIEENGEQIYRGIQSGYESDVEYVVNGNSSYSDVLKTLPQLGVMMTSVELQFIKAELALKGFTTGSSPRQHYEAGIAHSMAQWEVSMPADFLEQESIAYDEGATLESQLEQIMLQKYFALFFCDYQMWFEKRRTGYPVLPRGAGIPAENQFPSRLTYPTYLQSMNPEKLNAAVQRIGGDDSDTKVWWDE